MVNYNLRIGKHKARYTPLAVKMPALKDVDEKGKQDLYAYEKLDLLKKYVANIKWG